jgi:hypothetical protein
MAPSKSPLMRLGHIRDEIASLLPLFNNVPFDYWGCHPFRRSCAAAARRRDPALLTPH